VENTFDAPCSHASDRMGFFGRNVENRIEPCDLEQCPEVICRPQKDQLAAFASNGIRNGNQLT
jgi:hypothetical protein